MIYQTPRIVPAGGHRGLYGTLAVILALAIAATAGYLFSESKKLTSKHALIDQIDAQSRRIKELEQQLSAAGEQVALLERASQVDRQAVAKIKKQLTEFQEQRSKQEEELTFLRSLVASKDNREGIQVRRFSLAQGKGTREFKFRFTVSQTLNNGTEASGWVFVAVDGLRNGEPAWLPLRELTQQKTERLKMRFKNFQDIQGAIELPENFTPLKFIVEIKPSNKKIPEIKQRFEWKVNS